MAKDTVEIKFGELNLLAEGVYIPFRAGRMYLSNGDPGYPDEPAEFEITDIKHNGFSISEILNEIDSFYYNQFKDKIKYVGIWEKLSEICTEEYSKLLND